MPNDISDPIKNCLLELCCEPAAAVKAMSVLLVERGLCAEAEEAGRIAAWMHAHFDLAEKGTLAPLKASIRRLVKA